MAGRPFDRPSVGFPRDSISNHVFQRTATVSPLWKQKKRKRKNDDAPGDEKCSDTRVTDSRGFPAITSGSNSRPDWLADPYPHSNPTYYASPKWYAYVSRFQSKS